jgi:CheY-like chemotaxis protein
MPRILVADDDAWQLDLRCRLLEAGGHKVALAFNPSEAMRHLSAVDLIIMDLRFPNAEGEADPAEGLALIRRIRDTGCQLPLIVVSGWPEDLAGRPEADLVTLVLAKPVGMQNMLRAIQELVE